jgi:hypothetical protein
MAGRPKGIYHPENYTYIGRYGLDAEKFFSKLLENEEGCKLWTAATHRQGYGMVSVYNTLLQTRQMQVTHRVAMMLHLERELQPEEFVVHEFCDNQLCCNPEHMIVGTAHDRNRVQYAKGRRPVMPKRGDQVKKQNRKYKYSEEDMRFFKYCTTREIAEKYKLSNTEAAQLHYKFKKGYKWL